jgi:hypothetical protein
MFFSYRDYSAVYVNIFLNKQQIFTLLIFRIFLFHFYFSYFVVSPLLSSIFHLFS